jgi:hypothetical protein
MLDLSAIPIADIQMREVRLVHQDLMRCLSGASRN